MTEKKYESKLEELRESVSKIEKAYCEYCCVYMSLLEEISCKEAETRDLITKANTRNKELTRRLLEKRLKEIIEFSKSYDCVVCVMNKYAGIYELMNRLKKFFEASGKEFIVTSEDGFHNHVAFRAGDHDSDFIEKILEVWNPNPLDIKCKFI